MPRDETEEEKAARRARKLEKKLKKKQEAEEGGSPISSTTVLVAVAAIALLVVLRVTYDDGSGSKSKGADDLMDGVDLYEALGVEKGASDKEVKKGYHKMAMKWHPDKNPGCEECKLTFQRTARAYEVLADPMKRRIYDNEQQMMEKSIASNTAVITTANYKEMVLESNDVWIIQVYTDWSGHCQALSPVWEELARKLEGTGVKIGRVNLGREKGLASALMGSKETVPSVAAWSGKKELRRVRWEFQDMSTDGLVKWVALAVSEHYKVRTLDEVKKLEGYMRKDDRSRALFVGKAGSRQQISFVCAAGRLGVPLIATTSKQSVAKAAIPTLKPPAALVCRGSFVSIGDCGAEMYSGNSFSSEAMEAFLSPRVANIAAQLYSDTWAATCGAAEWCVVAVVQEALADVVKSGVYAAASAVGAGTGRVPPGGGFASGAGGGEGDVVVLRRGGSELRGWVVAGGVSAADLTERVDSIVGSEGGGKILGEEASLVKTLGAKPVSYLMILGETVETLPVEVMILVYLAIGICMLVVICPIIKPFVMALDSHRFEEQDGRGSAEGGEDCDGEEGEEDFTLVDNADKED